MSMSVKRVFAQRWADMSDDDSLGELPSTAAIKAQLASTNPPTATASPPAANQPVSPTDSLAATPPLHDKLVIPPPTPVKPTVATLTADQQPPPPTTTTIIVTAATTVSTKTSVTAATSESTVTSLASVTFQSKPKPGFKSWTDLARSHPTAFFASAHTASAGSKSPFNTVATDPVRRVLAFGDSDDENSRMDAAPLVSAASATLAPPSMAYDPELDNSRDGLPLLLKQSTMMSGLSRLAEDDNDGMDASMETSRDRGIKRKQAEAEAPTPRNTPVKEAAVQQSQQLVTAWAAGKAAALFNKTQSASQAQQAKQEAAASPSAAVECAPKKQKVSTSLAVPVCPAPLPVSIIRPVSVTGRVTRSEWKRINDSAPQTAPPSPALSAINSAAQAQRKQRMIVKKKDLPAATTSLAASAAADIAIPATSALTIATPSSASPSSAATAASPDSPTSSTTAAPAPPPSPRTLVRRLEQRHKQIELGKRTVGYQRYRGMVHKRDRVAGQHPRTPNAKRPCSKRSWDGQVRKWRRELHRWDEGKNGEKEAGGSELGEESDVSGEGEEGEVSELGSEWSMRDDEGEASELSSELGSELSSRRGEEEEVSEMAVQDDVAVV